MPAVYSKGINDQRSVVSRKDHKRRNAISSINGVMREIGG